MRFDDASIHSIALPEIIRIDDQIAFCTIDHNVPYIAVDVGWPWLRWHSQPDTREQLSQGFLGIEIFRRNLFGSARVFLVIVVDGLNRRWNVL